MEREIAALKRNPSSRPTSRAGSPVPGTDGEAFTYEVSGIGEKPDGAGDKWESNRKKKMVDLFKKNKTLPEGVSVKRVG